MCVPDFSVIGRVLMDTRDAYSGHRRRRGLRRRSAFKARQLSIARQLEGTTGQAKYAGKDRRYSHGEAMRSAGAISRSIGVQKYGQAEMTRRALAARRRNR